MPRQAYRNEHETKTECSCDRPLLVDESTLGMGVNCLKCGRSAERHLTSDERREIRERNQRSRRRREVAA